LGGIPRQRPRQWQYVDAGSRCVLLSQGEDSYKADQQVLAGTERDDIDELTTTAMQAYPGCHG
jgi:hypothetical protein